MKMNLETIFKNLYFSTILAGLAAKNLQHYAENTKKTMEDMQADNDYIKQMRGAISVADKIVQEMLLVSVVSEVSRCVILDAEERTNSVALFRPEGKKEPNVSLVLDPIDGSLAYLSGQDNYSICSAIVSKGKIAIALVYFPNPDIFYFMPPHGQGYMLERAHLNHLKNARPISIKTSTILPKKIYKNSRVPDQIVRILAQQGYEVIDDTHNHISCPGAIIECMEGRALAYLAHTRNLRDILLGAILGNSEGGKALDWGGKTLIWPYQGRVKRALFTMFTLPSDVIPALREDE